MKKIIFLKLGGSLITDKTKPFSVRMPVIRILVRQIKMALDSDRNLQLVIGNGAGSYAHYPATNYNMTKPLSEDRQIEGFVKVQDAAAQLNRIIVAELLKVGVRAISLNPSSMVISKRGKIQTFLIDHFVGFLKIGVIPVLYGDIVYDESYGYKIFSTEQLLSELAKRFIKKNIKIAKIIHNGITRGVLDNEGKLVKVITAKTFSTIKSFFSKAKGFDVTGGMIHKVEESLVLTKYGIKTLIINGTAKKDLLKKALCEEAVEGTLITA